MLRRYISIAVVLSVLCICGCQKNEGTIAKDDSQTTANESPSQPLLVKIETTMGDITIELNGEKSPVTVDNFLCYVSEGFYEGTIFHRVINRFMIQGGGFTEAMQKKKTHAPIDNEASNGLKNKRGTIAMARTSNPDSATSQFFINHKDNFPLDYIYGQNHGYAVLGKVTEGMEVVDKIATVKTTTRNGMRDVPAEPVIIKSVKLIEQEK